MIRRPRLSRSERVRRVNAILKFLGLTHIASRRVGEMNARTISDGERTRLNLGLDLAGIADVFLLDEPISGLSTSDAKLVMQTMQNMSRDKMVIATMHRAQHGYSEPVPQSAGAGPRRPDGLLGGRAGHDAVFPEGGCGHGY